MRKMLVIGLVCVVVAFAFGCVGPIKGLYPPESGLPSKTVYVVGHGWHTGIVVERANVSRGVWPESNLFPNARFLEVGWGDDDFYQSDNPSCWVTCKAAFWPTPSALQVTGYHEPIRAALPNAEIIAVRLSEAGHEKLCQFIERSYRRDKNGAIIPLGTGQSGDAHFYGATGKFYLPKTCNTWTARALRSAGCPIRSCYAITSGNLLRKVKKFGEVIPATESTTKQNGVR